LKDLKTRRTIEAEEKEEAGKEVANVEKRVLKQ
jgi:hypothetical protein